MAFKTKAEPVMEEFRRKYPNMMPKYARNVTDNPDKPRYGFSASDYLGYNAPSHTSERPVTEYIPIQRIEKFASEALRVCADMCGVERVDVEFPSTRNCWCVVFLTSTCTMTQKVYSTKSIRLYLVAYTLTGLPRPGAVIDSLPSIRPDAFRL